MKFQKVGIFFMNILTKLLNIFLLKYVCKNSQEKILARKHSERDFLHQLKTKCTNKPKQKETHVPQCSLQHYLQ